MSNAVSIHAEDRQHLLLLHEDFQKVSCRIGASTAAATFLVLGALIVITSSCLCLSLPGINVLTQVILPGVLPGIGALLLSLPLIVYSVLRSKEKNRQRRELIDFSLMLLNFHHVENLSRREKISFIRTHLMETSWSKEYAGRVISDFKARYPTEESEQTEAQKALIKAFDKVKIRIAQGPRRTE